MNETKEQLETLLNQTKIKFADAIFEHKKAQVYLQETANFCAKLENQILQISENLQKVEKD